jgi:cytosine/adenosine deaminase-related metal-dependent hydrolase
LTTGDDEALVTAVRGHLISFRDDPFFNDDALVDITDGLVVVEGGVITAIGGYATLNPPCPRAREIDHYPDALICAGFIDTHIHYVQTGGDEPCDGEPVRSPARPAAGRRARSGRPADTDRKMG